MRYKLSVIAAVCCFALVASVGRADEDVFPEPQFPRVIMGRITDTKERGVAGARVAWGYFSDPTDKHDSTMTDEEGRFRLEVTNVGQDFRLGVSKPGFAPVWLDTIVPGPMSRPTNTSLTLRPGLSVTVQFTTKSGQRIEGLRVTPQTPSNGFFSSFSMPPQPSPYPGTDRTVTTDAAGMATFVDLPLTFPTPSEKETVKPRVGMQNWLGLVYVDREGSRRTHQITEQDVVRDKPIVIELPDSQVPGAPVAKKDAVVRGRVVDDVSGEPIGEFDVTIRYRAEAQHVASASGEFEVAGNLKPGQVCETRVFARGYAVGVMRIKADAPERAKAPEMRLVQQPSFEGRLVDAKTGRPLANVPLVTGTAPRAGTVIVEWAGVKDFADGHHGFENVLRVTTDAEGRFTVPEPADKPAAVIVNHPDYERRVVMPEDRPTPDANGVYQIALEPAAVVTAVVDRETQLGKLATAVLLQHERTGRVDEMSEHVAIDSSGRVDIRGLAPGVYLATLYYQTRNASYPIYTRKLTLTAGEKTEVLLGGMPGDLSLKGKAAPYAMVIASPVPAGELGQFSVPADVDGRFELRGLAPGKYHLETSVNSAASGFHGYRRHADVELSSDAEVDLTNGVESRF